MTSALDLVMGSSLGAMEADEVLNLIDLLNLHQLTQYLTRSRAILESGA